MNSCKMQIKTKHFENAVCQCPVPFKSIFNKKIYNIVLGFKLLLYILKLYRQWALFMKHEQNYFLCKSLVRPF